jgi:hypothetical protein
MKLTDPCPIGYPAREEPLLLGSLSSHGLPKDLLIGTRVEIRGKSFSVNVSYVPANPKREKLVVILVPREKLDSDFWGENVVRAEEKIEPPKKQEEFPF